MVPAPYVWNCVAMDWICASIAFCAELVSMGTNGCPGCVFASVPYNVSTFVATLLAVWMRFCTAACCCRSVEQPAPLGAAWQAESCVWRFDAAWRSELTSAAVVANCDALYRAGLGPTFARPGVPGLHALTGGCTAQLACGFS